MQQPSDDADDDGFVAETYGRSFADVYDRWYPADDATGAAVERISELAGPSGAVLELGVGTGRLAVPLAERGHRVVGIDASSDMLARLADNAHHLPTGRLDAVHLDLASDEAWPPGPFAVVVAAFNLVCNVVDPRHQERLVTRSAAVLQPGGHLVVETFLADAPERRERHLEVREVRSDGVVLIASDTHPDLGLVTGAHVELRDGEPVRVRPWRLRVTAPDELDRWATSAGLELVAARHDWSASGPGDVGGATDGDGASAGDGSARIAVYRRPPAP